jgi:hypothetical protein
MIYRISVKEISHIPEKKVVPTEFVIELSMRPGLLTFCRMKELDYSKKSSKYSTYRRKSSSGTSSSALSLVGGYTTHYPVYHD